MWAAGGHCDGRRSRSVHSLADSAGREWLLWRQQVGRSSPERSVPTAAALPVSPSTRPLGCAGKYVKRISFAHGSKRCIAQIALGEEPPLAYTIHHACLLVHHCLSVDSGCLRKEGGRISRTAWPSWASWPCRPPRWNGHSFRRSRMSPDLRGCVRG